MKVVDLFESAPLTLYHGYTGKVVDKLSPPIHFAYDKKLANLYGAGKVGTFLVTLKTPLVIQTDAQFRALWAEAGLEEPEDTASMAELKTVQNFAQKHMHDGIIFKQGLWDKSELFQNTFGDEQVIVFDTAAVQPVA